MVRSVFSICVVNFLVSQSQGAHFGGVLGGPDAATETMRALDADHSGFIDMKEIGVLIQNQGLSLSPEELKADFQDLDKDGDGQLGEAELRGVIGESPTPNHAADKPDKPHTAVATAAILESTPAAILESPPAAILAPPPAAVLASPPAAVLVSPPAAILASSPAAILATPPAAILASPPAVSDTAPADMLDSRLLLQVREQAGKFLAATFAKEAGEAFARSKKSGESAVAWEAAAQSHRYNISNLVEAVPVDVANAVSLSVANDINMNTGAVEQLRLAAVQAETEAQTSRADAGAAMDEATHAQTEMMSAIQKLQVPGA